MDDGDGGAEVGVRMQATLKKQKLVLAAVKAVADQLEEKLEERDAQERRWCDSEVKRNLKRRGFTDREIEVFSNIKDHLQTLDAVQTEILVHEILAVVHRVKSGR